jgi:hypothetical protein
LLNTDAELAALGTDTKADIVVSPLTVLTNKRDNLKEELTKGKPVGQHRKILQNSEEYQTLLKQIKNFGNQANKIIKLLDSQDVQDINTFMGWAVENLPDFITIGDINTLGNNMKAGGVRVGAFALNLHDLAGKLNISGTLYTGAKSPFRYHEAFHGVFRMLLTDVEIKKYLAIARKEVRANLRAEGKSFEAELQRFKNSADTYSNMSPEILEQEYYEEYLADQFELFKENPRATKTDSAIKSLFTRILEWIKSLFNSYHKTELLTLFENIDAGKFKTSALVSNQFTNGLATGVTLEANALIPYEKVEDSNSQGYLFLNSALADPLIRSIAAMYLSRVSKITTFNTTRSEVLDGVIDNFYELYHPDSAINVDKTEEQKEILNSIIKSFDNYIDQIKNQVYNILNVIDGQILEEEYNTEYFEDTIGLRGADQWNTDASLIGGINSTPKQIRAYLATTVMEATDLFGNTELVEGEPLIIPVPFNEVYNGLLKSTKNIADPKKMLQNMYFFGQQNPSTGAVVKRILQDLGVTEETLLNDSPLPLQLKDPLLFQSITKTFENFRVDYLFTQRDLMGNILMYSAAERDDINSQVDRWAQAWNDAQYKIKVNEKTKNRTLKTLTELMSLLKETSPKSTVDATETAIKYSKLLFELTGIKLSTQYMLYSILYNRVESGNVFKTEIENEDGTVSKQLDIKQRALIQLHKNEETPLTSEVIREMHSIINNGDNIFDDGATGMNSRLVNIAKNNAPFDETIGLSVFKNPEGNFVYAHQKSTFHLYQVELLNDIEYLKKLENDDPYLYTNYLLNNPAFIQLSKDNRQKIIRVAGGSVGQINSTEEQINENISTVSSKSTYGNFTPQEFALNLLNTYTALVNSKSGKVQFVEYIDPITNEKRKTALAPSLIRVLEASNTGDMMYLPVMKAVKFAKEKSEDIILTDELIDVFIDSIYTEYKRIQREVNSNTATKEQIVGYNIEGIGENGEPLTTRAYNLHNSALLLTPQLKTELEEYARRNKVISLEEALSEQNITMDDFRSEVIEQLESQFTQFKNILQSLNIDTEISNKIKDGLIGTEVKSNDNLVTSNDLLNLTSNEEYNLKQIFFNDWANTHSINEIFLGDQAVTLKNGIDAIKRGKGQNATFISANSAITAPELGVYHTVDDISLVTLEEPVDNSANTGKKIDKADAQMWMTVKAFRYMHFGFGTLSKLQTKILDKIEQGEDILSSEIFGEEVKIVNTTVMNDNQIQTFIVKDKKIFDINGIEALQLNQNTKEKIFELAKKEKTTTLDGLVDQDDAMLNSKKLVYFDGRTYIKMSAFVLTKQLTSNKVVKEDGTITWVAKETTKPLHDLRIKLEDIESTKDTISIAAPLSALKMLKQNVKSLEDIAGSRRFDKNDYTTLSAKNMGLQVVTPSNKKESIDPAQIKTLVTSEQDDATKVPGMLKPNGKPMDLGYIRKEYNKAVSRRVEIKYKNKRNLIFTFDTAMNELKISKVKGKLTPNLIAFLRFAQEGLKASQSSSQLLDFFSTENGEQKYDLNNPNTIAKFEQLFLSYMSKGTLAEKQPGLSLTLVSDFGKKVYRRVYSIDKDGIPDRSEIIREKVWENLTDKPEIVEFDTLLGRKIPKEGIVVLDRLRSGVKEYDINGKFTGLRYTEMLMPAHFKSVMDLVENSNGAFPDVLSKMFGVRIPSQDNHSTINIKHVDFLPAYYGSSAMFAQELIEISGADFDIDKVIAQIKEFYVENNKFIEYGKGKTESNRYDEYLRYVSEKVQKKGTIYNEAYQLYIEDNQSARIQNSVTDAEQNSVTDAGLSENGLKALQMLGLPITLKQYSEYFKNHGEPYEAPMNNQILDYKYALMGNTHVTQDTFDNELPISYQPANLDVLNFNLNLLISESDVFKKRNEEDNADIDNMLGKINAFISNKGASIGAIVKPNVNLSLLTEYGIEIKGTSIKINGIKYNKFGVLREQLIDGTEGVRKQDIISALITMATDNAKERLVAKLGLNRSALGLAANLTALGVPLYTSLLLINNPSIQSIYNEALNKKEKTDPGVKSLIQEQLLLLKVKPEEFVNVTDSLLLESINNPIDGMSSNVSQSDKNKLASILNLVLDGIKIQDFTAKMSSVSNLTNGLGRSIAEVNKRKTDIDELLDPKAIMDLSPIYKSDTWQSKYVEIFNQIVEQILPEIFLSASVPFQSILNSTLKNVNENNLNFNEDVLPKISRDLLSYITIKAYQHNKLNNNSQSAATLNNNFIYPVDENQADNSIVKVINKLKQRDDMKNNYFLESFVNIINALDISNQSGLNLLNANTFISLNPLQKVDLQSAFSQIYGTASTKDDAMSIINYIMVKSGLQVEYGTLLDAISPFTLGNYLSQIATSNDALRNPKDSEKMKSVFGLTFNELKDEFINGYMQSNVNNSYLNTFEYNEFNSKIKLVRQKDKSTSFIVSLDYALSSKDYFRVQFTSSSGSTYYTTYMKKEQNEEGQFARYDEIPTYGSNQQWGGGFMFGERPTYKEVRKYVNDKNNVKSDEAEAIQSEGISNYDTQPTSEVKEGVSELFKENTELSEIGTEQQYSEYLDSVFPNSKVNDIVYHGTKGERFEKFVENLESTERQGFFFTRDKNAAYSIKGGNVLQVLLDIKNLEFISQEDRAEFRNIGSPKDILKEAGFDAVEIEGFADGTEINIFEPEQIHILGSKQDVKAFKEFVTQPSTQLSTIKPGFVGKIVYATPGSGKTTLAESTNNIVDMDKLMMEEMTKRQPDFKQDENETIQDAIYRYVITYKDKSSVNSAVLDEAKKLAAQGKTVLTGTLAFIKDADIVLRMNPESLRAINKFKTLEKSKEFARKEKAAAANKGATETKAIEETLMDYSNPQSTVIPKEETERFLTDPTSNIEVTNAEIKINGVNIADVVEKEDDVIDVEEMTIVKTDEKTNDKTITYKPIGKETQTYTIRGNKIFNKNNVEVFKIDSVDKNKIFANLAIQEGRASVKSEIKSSIVKNNWTKDSPKENPNTAYIFTENINSIGSSRVGGGSAVIRNNPNAIGIVTKKYYVYAEDRATSKVTGGWNQDFQDTKEDFELFKKVNLEQFTKIDKYDNKIFPQGFASDLAKIPTKFAEWLQNELLTRYGLVTELNANKTGLISKSITQSSTSVKNFDKKNLFKVNPIQAADKKATIKASIATQYIGFGEGITGSSTENYRQQAGAFANTGNYSANDVIFVSIGGKRGTELQQKTQQDRTIKEAIKAVEAGATILTDNKAYTEASNYNTGEQRLYANMKAKGYNYSEVTVDGQVIGTWSKPTEPSTSVKEGVSELFESNPELAKIGTPEQYSQYLDSLNKPNTNPILQGNQKNK